MTTPNFTYTIFEALVSSTKVDNYQIFIPFRKSIGQLLTFCCTDEFYSKMLV